jgi:hypothetical protein
LGGIRLLTNGAESPLTTGSVFREALVVFGRHWWRYVFLYSLPALPVLAAGHLVAQPWNLLVVGIALPLYVAVSQAAVAYAVLNEPAARGLGLAAYVGVGKRIPHVVAATVVYLLLALLGFWLLIVPGCLLVARWSVYVPALVRERRIGLGLGRSTGLTESHRWTGFWISLIPVLLIVTESVIDPENELASWAMVAMDVVLSAYAIVAAAVFYRRLTVITSPPEVPAGNLSSMS